MGRFGAVVVVGALAAVGAGLGASAASGYSISGGSYVGTPEVAVTATFDGVYTTDCGASSSSYWGTASGAASTNFTPSFGGCSWVGFPATVSQSGAWSITVTGGPDFQGWYTGTLYIPSGTTTSFNAPVAGCTTTVSGAQSFSDGVGGNVVRIRNTSLGATAEYTVFGVVYTASGCPYSSGTNGVLSSNGSIRFYGVSVS